MEKIRLSQFPSVAANAESTLVTQELRGKSVHALLFERGGTFTNAHLSGIRIALGGKDITPSDLTGAQLVDMNKYDGLADVTGYTAYFFGDPLAFSLRGKHLGDLDLSLYDAPLEINVDIGGATNPTLEVLALCGAPKVDMGIGYTPAEAAQFRALIRTQIQPSGAVTRKAYSFALGSAAGAWWRRQYMFHTNITAVEYKKGSLIKHDDFTVAENGAVAQQFARVPQSGLYVLDHIVDGNNGEREATVDANGRPFSQEVKVTTSGGDTINTYADVHITHGSL